MTTQQTNVYQGRQTNKLDSKQDLEVQLGFRRKSALIATQQSNEQDIKQLRTATNGVNAPPY